MPIRNILYISGLSILAVACSNPPSPTAPVATEAQQDSIDLQKAGEMVGQLPSPIELAILIKHSGGVYDGTALNPIKNLDGYQTEAKRTMNLGVYGADVGYTSLYKQTQETMFYMNNVRKLSDAIGLSKAFDQELFDRVEANIQYRDSLLKLLGGAYDRANVYLRENERTDVSLLMLAGGWVESMYLASKLGPGGKPNDNILKQIHAQRQVLDKIISATALVNEPNVKDLHNQLMPIKTLLDADGLTTGEGENMTVNVPAFEPVLLKIAEVRGWMIS